MKTILYSILYVVELLSAIFLAIVANLFCWLIALFVDKETGNLPKLLRWFQTPDATCYDEMWVAEHPTWSKYKIAWTWIARNPAYGFRKMCNARTSGIVSTYGNINIADGLNGVAGWFFITDKSGAWNFCFIIDLKNGTCFRGNWGWYLVPLSKGYYSINTGMLEADIFRFYDFGREGK